MVFVTTGGCITAIFYFARFIFNLKRSPYDLLDIEFVDVRAAIG